VLIVTVGLGAGGYSFLEAFREARELQDHTLIQIGRLLSNSPVATATSTNLPAPREDPESQFVIVSMRESTVPRRSPFRLNETMKDGFQTIDGDSEAWRIYVTRSADGARVAVGQRTAVRDELATDAALRIVFSLMLLIPILLLVIHDLLRKNFAPLENMARTVEARGDQDLTPFATAGMFAEVRPFVVAINRLFARVTDFVGAQKRFVADAAHELRSPLTALSLQAERLAQAPMSDEARKRLEVLSGGIGRSRALLEQMLTYARVQEGAGQGGEPIALRAAVARVIEDLLPQADAKHIDLGVGSLCDALVPIAPFDFSILLKNLLDNAIRYTPDGGRVDVSAVADGGALILTVEDNGPGLAPEDRQKVFEPFHRLLGNPVAGSGLGLSIVEAILERSGGSIALDYTDPEARRGLRADIHFANPHPRVPSTAGRRREHRA